MTRDEELEALRAQVAALTAERDELLNPTCACCGGNRQVWLGNPEADGVWTRVATCPVCNGKGTAQMNYELVEQLSLIRTGTNAYMEDALYAVTKVQVSR